MHQNKIEDKILSILKEAGGEMKNQHLFKLLLPECTDIDVIGKALVDLEDRNQIKWTPTSTSLGPPHKKLPPTEP